MSNRIEKALKLDIDALILWKIFEDETKGSYFRTGSDELFFKEGMIYTFQKLRDLGVVFNKIKIKDKV